MALAAGTRLGPYEVTAQIGVGGMGEVYRATDTKLKRQAAIKVLPGSLANDPDRLARFQREAEVLASLNHPNIAAIYGLEDTSGVKALAIELVEGRTLADRIAQGAIPIDEALPIAKQLAEALEAAHDQGIIHRDLKPANVMMRMDGTVKVLDFGLAKAFEPVAASPAVSQSPTITEPVMTKVGVILGTAAYMSPEQARGRAVDKRTDIWAFGCVLYEMLAGRRAFSGQTVTETLAAVLERQPDWQALPTSTPGGIRKLVQRCLQKEPKSRLHDIADARFELDEAPREATLVSEPLARPVAWAVVVIGCAASLGLGWLLGARSGPETPVVSRWLLDVRPATALLGADPRERAPYGRFRPSRLALALSPDGRTLAFTAQRDGTPLLYIRALDRAEATAITGTEGADGPVFSPGGDWVAFWAAGAIRKVALAGGPPVKVGDADLPLGSTWPSDDTIVYASATRTIWKIASAGGVPQQVTENLEGEVRHVVPQILPGGKWLLFTVLSAEGDWERARVVAQSLDTGERKVLLQGAADARYVPSGHLVFMRLGNLMAAPFDAERVRLTGPEVGMIPGIMQSVNSGAIGLDTGVGQYTCSSTGTLVYVSGQLHPDVEGTLHWISRDGSIQPIPVPAPVRPFNSPRLSPDGRHIIVATWSMRDWSLWRYDFADGTLARVTTEGRASFPVWSHDGTQILFRLTLGGQPSLFSMRADGDATPRLLGPGSGFVFPGAWTPDGRSVVFAEGPTGGRLDIKLLSVGSEPRVQPLIATRFNDRMPEISPDGRWLTYVSNETGRDEVYVRAFPGLGDRRQISTGGGVNPVWSRNGRKLLFLSPLEPPRESGFGVQLMEVDVTLGTTFTATSPRRLFESPFPADVMRYYDPTPDAGRFIFLRETYPPSTSAPREIHVIQHWFEELKRLVPTS